MFAGAHISIDLSVLPVSGPIGTVLGAAVGAIASGLGTDSVADSVDPARESGMRSAPLRKPRYSVRPGPEMGSWPRRVPDF